MNPNELNDAKIPILRLNHKLEKLRGKILFPKKLEEANRTLARVGIPKTS